MADAPWRTKSTESASTKAESRLSADAAFALVDVFAAFLYGAGVARRVFVVPVFRPANPEPP